MSNKLISIRVPDTLISETNAIVSEKGFNNLQEFVRETWRKAIDEHKRDYVLRELDKLAGSTKDKDVKIATKKELEQLAKKLQGN